MSADSNADAPADAGTGARTAEAAADGTVLQTKGVTKRFGGLTAVDDVDMEVREGEVVGLIGPNGAGKSTLFNCITGHLPADDGRVYFDGTDVTDWSEDRIAREGLVRTFQHTRVFREMTTMENVLVAASEDRGVANALQPPSDGARENAAELLEYIGLSGLADVAAGRMSFGQQKLLEFAMALRADPDLLLMDEPAGGINPSMLNKLIEYIDSANTDHDVTILLIEHNMDFVMNVADRIYVLAHGEKIAEGPPEQIQKDERVLDAYLGRE